jgi:hypothetical protein
MGALLLFSVAIWCAMLGCANVDDVKSKEEYSVLQVVEYDHRPTPVVGVEIIKKDGYLVAGFRSEGGNENVWVLLNARYPPYYKQVPAATFKVSQRALDVVRQTEGVSKAVLAALEARVSSQGS